MKSEDKDKYFNEGNIFKTIVAKSNILMLKCMRYNIQQK